MTITKEFLFVAVREKRAPCAILGFLRVPKDEVTLVRPTMVAMKGRGPCMIVFMPLENIVRNVWETELSICAEDKPLSFWREVEGFVEAGDARLMTAAPDLLAKAEAAG